MNDNVEVNDGGEGNDNNVEDDGDEDHVDEDDVEEEEHDEEEDDGEEEDHEDDAEDGEEARGINGGESIDQERDGNDGPINPHDKTIVTYAVEIVQQLIEFGKTGQPLRNRSYALRYWLAVILRRWKDFQTDLQIESMMKIPRRTLRYPFTLR